MKHELKCWPEYFEYVIDGTKTFEMRFNDRDFKVGDQLNLKEWNRGVKEYTGRESNFKVTHVLYHYDGMRSGYVCMSIKPI